MPFLVVVAKNALKVSDTDAIIVLVYWIYTTNIEILLSCLNINLIFVRHKNKNFSYLWDVFLIMLTDPEKKELNYDKLSSELRNKIDAAFCSPYFNTVLAIYIQKLTLETEMIETPFTIRGDTDAGMDDGEDGVKKAIREAITSRQNTETALKAAKWLQEAAEDIEKLQAKLMPAEKKEMDKVVIAKAEEIKNEVRRKHGIE